MASEVLKTARSVIINTGNILSLSDITKNPGQNHTEELVEAINLTLKDYQNGGRDTVNEAEYPIVINRRHDDLTNKIAEQDITELKIGFKVFLTCDNHILLTEALEKAFGALNVSSVHNVIIQYNHKLEGGQNDIVGKLQNIWKVLEEYAKDKKVLQIGLSDVDENIFRVIYDWAEIKPSIIQINLSTCCVVPPTLQSFCKDNEVQLLTHSDPADLLPNDVVQSVLGDKFKLKWALRFLVHIKCRGVLQTKGYLIHLTKD